MKIINISSLFLVLAILNACSVIELPAKAYDTAKEFVFPSGEKLRWKKVSIGVGQKANKNFPVAVDIIMIFKEELVNRITELPANDWFNSKKYIVNTFPTGLAIKSWELAPGDTLQIPSSFFGEKRVFAVFAYADYFSEGEHKIRIDHLKGGVVLEFGIDGFFAYSIGK
ncbi:MAG: hypothetical protein CBD16_05675 [Betaproteobacteria bacterium TMED156]|mgnify:CR=1 FL=1|nr:MAG: hypothetical protein CBD16_05675 [Betaproteobacteria bacterium TMED156]|tara:strand:+ start:586 stop:1092 length:507 start_codon:yes stop_codon:yes gene_type:complete